MAQNLKFFSQEWLDAAIEAVNANEAIYNGFKDPESFTNKMEFRTTGNEGVASHLEWERGRLVSWTQPKFEESELWLIITGGLDTWKTAAAGDEQGGRLLLAGKMKFLQGPMSAAIENAEALNNFLLTWGQVPTDWDV
ncbi:hypothetical protein [Gordonia rubripertincta]|uniref:hypothetical protein n=1 Tax=Gordonia rubripertincta TaxID=36822 RepID=UPI000B8D3A95|nr:hypothetical protein [Gordonia rubripertincta]ASR05588.1 hypothetical protein GCWB2_24085 [Gordonia rubripertincta]